MLPASRFDATAGLCFPILRGRVERVYRLAAHIRPAGGGDLVVLAADDAGGQPNGINVRGVVDFRLVFRVGWPAVVDLAAAQRWSPRLPEAAKLRSPDSMWAGLRQAELEAAARAPRGGFGPLLSGEPPSDVVSAAGCVRAARLGNVLGIAPLDAARAAVALLGLGPGLTPSGDDYLVGLLGALEVLDHPARRGIALAVTAHGAERTTELSARALSNAAHGRYPERLHDVLAAIVSNDARAIPRSIERAMRYGATSGADTIVGVFAGLRAGLANVEAAA